MLEMNLKKFLNQPDESKFDNLDSLCALIIKRNKNMCVPWYLMAAYAYYVEDNPIITDKMFDFLAKTMYNNWIEIDHYHKDLLSLDDLKAGTYLGEYPSIVCGGLTSLRAKYARNTKSLNKRSSR